MFNAQQNDFTFDWIKYVVVAAGGLTLLLGGIVLIGWYTQSTFLVQVRPEFVPMQYNTALAFIFCGTALIALVYRYSRLVLLCGGLSIGLSLLTLLQYILGLNLGIDQLFMESIIVVKTVYPGRMAQITAFSHLIYGIGLVIACGVVGSKWHDVLNGLLGTIVAAIGMGTLFGYLLGAETPYGWSYLTYMAVHTAFGFVLLGLGLFIFAIHKGLREGRRPTWISVAVGIGVATLAVALWQALLTQERLKNTQAVVRQATHLKTEIELEVKNQILALERMAGRWEQQGGTPKALWAADAARYLQHNPGLETISWIDSTMHVRWIEPVQGNEATKDLYLPFELRRAQILEIARREHVTTATRNIELAQGKATIVYVPLYVGDRFDGYIGGVFRINILLESLFTSLASKDFGLELFEGNEKIYRRLEPAVTYEPGMSQEQTISIVNLEWRLRLQPSRTLLAELDSPVPLITLIVGLLLALLITLTMHFAQAAGRRADTLAELNQELTSEIIERERFKKALHESELWMRGIFNALQEGVLVATHDRKFVDMNPASEVMLGYTKQELVNQSTEMVHVDHDHYVEFSKRIQAAFDRGEAACFEFELKRKNGEVFPSEHMISLIQNEQGEAIGIVSSVLDITVRKQAGQELQQHREHLEELVAARTNEFQQTNQHLQQEIIEHQRAQEKLRAQTQRNELILSTMQDGFWIVDLDGNLREINETYRQLLGYSREQLLSMNIADIEVCESPEEVNMHTQKIMTQGYDRFETQHRCQNGTLVDLDVSVSLADLNGERFFFAFFRDITQRKQMELVLLENEQYLRAMFDNMQEGVIVTNEDGVIESANPTILKIFNYEHEELLGQNVSMLMRAVDRDVHTRQMEHHCEHNNASASYNVVGIGPREVIAMRADGSEFHMSIAIGEMWVAGQRKFISIVKDISESKIAQQELQHSRQQLRKLTGHLQTVREDERARIARDVHDELGQVLTALNIDVDWLSRHIPEQDVELQQKVKLMLPLITSAMNSVQRIISELRPAMLDDLGLGPAVQWYVEQFQDRTGINCQSSVELEDIQFNSEYSIAAFRIMQEGLTNVVRHAGATQVTLIFRIEGNQLTMRLVDNGKGIKPSEINAGNSFGLMGMQERAQALGGSVFIEGQTGTGTTLTLQLPLHNMIQE